MAGRDKVAVEVGGRFVEVILKMNPGLIALSCFLGIFLKSPIESCEGNS